MVTAHLEEDGTPPAEAARRLGTTRQATHDLVKGLVHLDLLVVRDNPLRRGGRLICLTPRGRDLALDAYAVLLDLEQGLGDDTVRQLRRLLSDLRLEPVPGRLRPPSGRR